MPKRSNLFQDVVAILHRHAAPGAEVEDSGLLVDKDTGEEREVDVVIRQRVAGHEVIVCVEAIDHGRVADVTWVDEMLGKHESLPTSKVVLVSSSGFTGPAERKAKQNGAVPMTPQDIEGPDVDAAVIGKVSEVWPKAVSLTVTGVKLVVLVSDEPVVLTDVTSDFDIVREDGTSCTHMQDLANSYANAILERSFETLAADVTKPEAVVAFEADIEPIEVIADGEPRSVFLKHTSAAGDERLDQIVAMKLYLVGTVSAGPPIELTHRQIGDQKAAYGATFAGDDPAVLVVIGEEDGESAHLRIRKAGEQTSTDIPLRRGTSLPSPEPGADSRSD